MATSHLLQLRQNGLRATCRLTSSSSARGPKLYVDSPKPLSRLRRVQTKATDADAEPVEAEIVAPTPASAPTPAPAPGPSSSSATTSASSSFPSPTPQRFYVEPDNLGLIAGATLPFVLRLGSGALTSGHSVSLVANDDSKYSFQRLGDQMVCETTKVDTFNRPAQPIVIYEFESCPFCRKVREAVAMLDLDVLFYPCPKDGPTWRPAVVAEGGKSMFPYMRDPNSGTAMYESDDIIEYLFREYGDGEVPLQLRMGPVTALTCGLSMMGRMGAGSAYRPSTLPEQPLELWAYEASPFCKVVREVLVELEIPHLLRSCARGSPKRQELFEETGTFQAPYIEDPNTGAAMFESAAIIKYLNDTYAK